MVCNRKYNIIRGDKMNSENKITIEMYVLQKLSTKISELEIENARLEFSALKYKQNAEELQQQIEEIRNNMKADNS